MNRLFGVPTVPKHHLSLIIATTKNAVVELIVADIFYLFLVMVEVTKRMDFIVFFFGGNVPKGEFAIIASGYDMAMFVGVPL
jgi:hypothetical protein